MSAIHLSRRNFLFSTAASLAATNTSLLWASEAHAAMPMSAFDPGDESQTNSATQNLDAYIAAYMPAMNAPGMTVGLTDATQTLRTSGYGYANIDRREAVNSSHLFQIGSISKSFVALVLLQLRDEGKLDLQEPVLDYMPWLPVTEGFGPITIHHLLTHTSGLPDNNGVFSSDPAARLIQGFKPGEHFHYCNAGFDILGILAAKLDGRTWRECVQARVLVPLGMNDTVGVITTASRARYATGYNIFLDDQTYSRQGQLAVAPWLVMDDTAGCIGSTPGDMAIYLRMLLNRGLGPKGRIVSAESFNLFSTPYIKAEEFSPTSSYGYGVAVDTLDGHKILRHTGGMVAFASSMHVDLDGGVAAFASINAMQGYRPTAVTEHAIRVLRAHNESKPLPAPPAVADSGELDNASDYAHTFIALDGRKLIFVAMEKRLWIEDRDADGKKLPPVPLQHIAGDTFISTMPGRFSTYAIEFGRVESKGDTAQKDAPPPVAEVSYGPDWFAGAAYRGPKTFPVPEDYAAFAGHYRSESPWGGDARVWILKGQLILGGETLSRIGGNLFRAADEPWSPDLLEFHVVTEGKARLLKFSGLDYWRVEVD